jgi:hypothetical protein
MKKLLKQNQKGTSMPELLVYMGLLTVLLLILTEIFVSMLNLRLKSQIESMVDQDGKYVMSRMIYDIGRADGITTPAVSGATTNSLSLDIGGENYTYSVSEGKIQLTDGQGTYSLTGSETEIPELIFTRYGKTVKITFLVKSVGISNTGEEERVYKTSLGIRP